MLVHQLVLELLLLDVLDLLVTSCDLLGALLVVDALRLLLTHILLVLLKELLELLLLLFDALVGLYGLHIGTRDLRLHVPLWRV